MPQAPIYSEPLDEALPRTRCTKNMADAVYLAAERHEVSVSDVIRVCIAYALQLDKENSDIVARMFRKAAKEN